MDVTFLAPAGTCCVILAAAFLYVYADQIPCSLDWAWSMDIIRRMGGSDSPDTVLFHDSLDVYRFTRVNAIPGLTLPCTRVLNEDVERNTRSHSQLSSWLQCGKAYELERILHVPRIPGIWFPAGTACHSTIEWWLRKRLEKGLR